MTPLHLVEQGNGKLQSADDGWTLGLDYADHTQYSNAMLTSYRSRADFTFAAGSRLELTAQVAGQVHGTAGFGFWNHPYGMGLRAPRAVWYFFASPPSNMPLAMGIPGRGFKAATFDAQRWPFFALLPTAPLGVLMMRVPFLYRLLWPVAQAAIGVDEFALDARLLATPRHYQIDWLRDRIEFAIDGISVFATRRVPRGKLGFVAWVDNQYAVVTPQGRAAFGFVDATDPQRLILSDLRLTSAMPP